MKLIFYKLDYQCCINYKNLIVDKIVYIYISVLINKLFNFESNIYWIS